VHSQWCAGCSIWWGIGLEIWQLIVSAIRDFLTRSTLANPDDTLLNAIGGNSTTSGVKVNTTSAMTSSAVLCAHRNLTESVAMLPWHLYRQDVAAGTKRHPAVDHPVYKLLKSNPNPELTPFQFKEWTQGSMLTRGNAYAEIQRNIHGAPTALWPLHASRVKPVRINGFRHYECQLDGGGTAIIEPQNMLHNRGFFEGGLVGLSLIQLGKEAIGTGIAQAKYESFFFNNASAPSGIITHPLSLEAKTKKNILAGWGKRHAGLDNSQRVSILDEGMSWTSTSVSPSDAQLIEGRKYSVLEVCRIFKVAPHKLFELSNATFSNIEQQSIEFVIFTLMPWLIRMEEQAEKSLLADSEIGQYYCKFNVDALLRGTIKERYEAYAIGKHNGFLSADDIRDREDLNPLPDGQGNIYTIPLNMQSAKDLAQPDGTVEPLNDGDSETKTAPTADRARAKRNQTVEYRRRLRRDFRKVLHGAASQVVHAESRELNKLLEKHIGQRSAETLGEAIRQYYGETAAAMIEKLLGPSFAAYGEAVTLAAATEMGGDVPDMAKFIADYTGQFAAQYGEKRQAEIAQIIANADPDLVAAEITDRMDEWNEKTADKVANNQVVKLGDAIATATFAGLGATALVWVANAGACPLCEELDGQTVGIEQSFVEKSGTVDPGDESVQPLVAKTNIGHAPLHGGCECTIAAG